MIFGFTATIVESHSPCLRFSGFWFGDPCEFSTLSIDVPAAWDDVVKAMGEEVAQENLVANLIMCSFGRTLSQAMYLGESVFLTSCSLLTVNLLLLVALQTHLPFYFYFLFLPFLLIFIYLFFIYVCVFFIIYIYLLFSKFFFFIIHFRYLLVPLVDVIFVFYSDLFHLPVSFYFDSRLFYRFLLHERTDLSHHHPVHHDQRTRLDIRHLPNQFNCSLPGRFRQSLSELSVDQQACEIV